MGLFKTNPLEVIALMAGCAAFSAVATIAYGQSATVTQFSDPYGGAAAYTDGPGPKTPKPAKLTANKISKSKIAAKKQPFAASALNATTWTLADPSLAAPTGAPAAPSIKASAPTKDSALGFGLKWYGANNPYYNASTSTISGVDEIKRDSNDLLGEPSSIGSGVEAGVNLKF